jgi:hypothetical protein
LFSEENYFRIFDYIFLSLGQWFFLCTPVSSTNKTDCQDITVILLKVALNPKIFIKNLQEEKQTSTLYVAPFGHIILIPSQPVFALSP